MCLIVKRGEKFKLSDGTVQCYKILIKKDDGYFTPYQKVEVNINETLKAEGELHRIHRLNKLDYIDEGLIHCFRTEMAAHDIMLSLALHNPTKEYVLWSCVIPKGVEYIKSPEIYMEIGAKEIKFDERVETLTLEKKDKNKYIINRSINKININFEVIP